MQIDDLINDFHIRASLHSLSTKRDNSHYIYDLLIELKDRRESELRPTTLFAGNTCSQQLEHISSEIAEVLDAYEQFSAAQMFTVKDITAIEHLRKELAMELADVQFACETMLQILGYNDHVRRVIRKTVIEKNAQRHYYDEPEAATECIKRNLP